MQKKYNSEYGNNSLGRTAHPREYPTRAGAPPLASLQGMSLNG
jgi:hypothetical protein